MKKKRVKDLIPPPLNKMLESLENIIISETTGAVGEEDGEDDGSGGRRVAS